MGYSVALIEQNGRLGGHVNTVVTPGTNKTFDIGVTFFENTTHTREYMSELGIELGVELINATFFTGGPTEFANFTTNGKFVTDLPPSLPFTNLTAVGLAVEGWLQQLQRFTFLSNGYNLPDPVPEDLLLTCGDFLAKHNLEAAANVISAVTQGVGNFLAQPTLYIMKYFNNPVTQAALDILPLLTTADGNNQGIYDVALRKLGNDAFLNSSVTSIRRSGNSEHGVLVSMTTPEGKRLVKAKKLLIAIPPTVDHLKSLGLDLEEKEERVFARLNGSFYFDMVIRNTGVPEGVSFLPIDLAAPLGFAATPILEVIEGNAAGIPDLSVAFFNGPSNISDEQVRAESLATVTRIIKANNLQTSGPPEIVEFHNHSPYQITLPVDDIRKGLYRTMNALQGESDTFYTGAAWQAENSAEIWAFNDNILLPELVKSLKG